jgi:hypothetical protein
MTHCPPGEGGNIINTCSVCAIITTVRGKFREIFLKKKISAKFSAIISTTLMSVCTVKITSVTVLYHVWYCFVKFLLIHISQKSTKSTRFFEKKNPEKKISTDNPGVEGKGGLFASSPILKLFMMIANPETLLLGDNW